MEELKGAILADLPISNLTWKRDLIYFDGPLLSEFISGKREIYLKYWCDCNNDYNRWMLFKIKEQDRLRLVIGEKSLLEVIKNQPDSFVFFADENSRESVYQMVISEDIPDSYLPEEDSFLDIEDYEEDSNIVSLLFENDWKFDRLNDVYNKFTQIYDFLFISKKTTHTLGASLPWQGGFSVVHFYNKIKEFIPDSQQSRFNSIHYASPGYMKIFANNEISNLTLKAINDYAHNKKTIDSIFSNLSSRITELKLNQVDPESARKGFESDGFCLGLYSDLCESLMGIETNWLHSFVNTDFGRCKMVMGHYRRLKAFHRYLNDETVRVVSSIIK